MQLRLVILSLACLCTLVPPALGSLHVAKAVAAVGAAKGAALLGAGALAVKGAVIKGAVAKGAALLAAKGAAVKGAIALAAKGAAVLKAKAAAAAAAALAVHKPVPELVEVPVPVEVPVQPVLVPEPARFNVPTLIPSPLAVRIAPPSIPSVVNSLTSLWSSAQHVLQNKVTAVGGALTALHPVRPLAYRAPVVFEPPRALYPVPMVEKVDCD